jgi:hypothetical protein
MSQTSLFHVWRAMKSRCKNPNNRGYKNYGGRGISVCDEWLTFTTFADWAFRNGYEEGLTLERIDVDGGYNPSNCKWIPPEKQAHNKRNNFTVEINGERKRLVQLCEEYGIDYMTVYQRINKLGWDTEKH